MLKYVGGKSSKRLWFCRCDCGVQKAVHHYNLTKGLSTQCQRCGRIKHGISGTRIHGAWVSMKRCGRVPKEWQDFAVFSKAVGDPPDKRAYLARYDYSKPHSLQNTFWMDPARLHNDPDYRDHLQQLRKQLREERVAREKLLIRIRNAKTREERLRRILAARTAGYTLELIATAARLSNQRVQAILAELRR